MWIRIEPLDVLLFRDSKPFSAGENFRAAGRFPPTSLPLIGALRSRAMAHINVDLNAYAQRARNGNHHEAFELLGGPNTLSPLSAMGPFVLSEDQAFCLPWPKDLLYEDEKESQLINVLSLVPRQPGKHWPIRSFHQQQPLCNLAPSGGTAGMTAPAGGFMDGENLFDYLTESIGGSSLSVSYIHQDLAAIPETRLGIALDTMGRTASKGRIYTAEFTRMKEGASFLLRLWNSRENGREKNLLPKTGLLSLGGEARAACFTCLYDDETEAIPESLQPGRLQVLEKELLKSLIGRRRFKIYLLSGAIFREGWLPDGVDKKTLFFQGPVPSARLIAAAVGKPDAIGGWNLVAKEPRPMYRLAPAGSVYFFESKKDLTEKTALKLLQYYHFKSLMRPEKDHSFPGFCRDAGFGLAVVGVWDYDRED